MVNLRDVVDFRGRDPDELERESATSIQTYLDVCREEGIEPGKPCSGKFQARLGEELHRKIAMATAMTASL